MVTRSQNSALHKIQPKRRGACQNSGSLARIYSFSEDLSTSTAICDECFRFHYVRDRTSRILNCMKFLNFDGNSRKFAILMIFRWRFWGEDSTIHSPNSLFLTVYSRKRTSNETFIHLCLLQLEYYYEFLRIFPFLHILFLPDFEIFFVYMPHCTFADRIKTNIACVINIILKLRMKLYANYCWTILGRSAPIVIRPFHSFVFSAGLEIPDYLSLFALSSHLPLKFLISSFWGTS